MARTRREIELTIDHLTNWSKFSQDQVRTLLLTQEGLRFWRLQMRREVECLEAEWGRVE